MSAVDYADQYGNPISVADQYSRLGLFTGEGGRTYRDSTEWPLPHRPRDVEVRLLKDGGSYAMRFRRTLPIEMVVAINEPNPPSEHGSHFSGGFSYPRPRHPDVSHGYPRQERVLFSISLVGQGRKRTSERIARAVEEFNAALKNAEQPTRWQRLREWLRF